MKTTFLGPTKLHSSPYYRCCAPGENYLSLNKRLKIKKILISKTKVKEIKV